MVYLDYNATTPLAPQAFAAMMPFLHDAFGNASSIHEAGRRARGAIDDARENLACLLGVKAALRLSSRAEEPKLAIWLSWAWRGLTLRAGGILLPPPQSITQCFTLSSISSTMKVSI